MPDIRVMDFSFTFKALLDACSSVQWTRKLWEVGTFEIHIDQKQEGARELQRGRIIFLDTRRAGIIASYEVQESRKGAEVVAKGVELKGLTFRRLTVPGQVQDTQYFGYDRFPALDAPDAAVESVMKYYAGRHMVNPDDPHRAFPGLIIAPDMQRGELTRWQSRFEPLDSVFKEIGEMYGMGYEIRLDLENELFVFDVIPGVDHTSGSASPIIFASGWGNMANVKYSEDESKWANAGYAGGAGEDEARLIQTVYEDDEITAGFDRRETWLDCGSIELVDDLLYEGKYKLKDKALVKALTGDMLPAGPFQYLQDWDLGDMVTVQSQAAGVELDTQITEVKESYEQGRVDVKPTFGKRTKGLLDDIRRIGVVR